MDTQTDNLIAADLDRRPEFYNNISGLPQTNRTDSFGVVNSSVVPIIKRITQVLRFTVNGDSTGWDLTVLGHGIGKVRILHFLFDINRDDPFFFVQITCHESTFL